MAGRIPQNFIDDLLARTDIVEVIDAYVPLKRAGKNYQARCPFHEEKTPSFTVSQDKQFYHCFGCGANGTAISFLMEYSGMGFVEAVEDLASRSGLAIPREEGVPVQPSSPNTELYELMELVVNFYRKQLREHDGARRAVDYLKSRGLSGELAARYEVGYAPPGWDNLLNTLGNSEAARGRLEKIGMLLKRDGGGHYDRFRDRIMFPIRDHRGRAIGFGGRVMGEETPKYLNSPETPIFQKGRELYGLYQARQQKRELDRIYIVEGYMDVLALAQFGINNSVATLGTAATPEHLEKLFRHSAQLVFCFDGDDAGRKAAWRALELCLPLLKEGRQTLFRFMPQGDDPDTFVRREGHETFEDRRQLVPLTDHLLERLKTEHDVRTREGRASLLEQAIPFVRKLPASALRQLLIQDLATLGQIEVEALKAMCQSQGSNRPAARRMAPRPQNASLSPVRKAIRLCLNYPEMVREIGNPEDLKVVDELGMPFLLELLCYIQQRDKTTTANILEHWRDTRYEIHLKQLLEEEELISDPELVRLKFRDITTTLIDKHTRKIRTQVAQAINDMETLKSHCSTPTEGKTDKSDLA